MGIVVGGEYEALLHVKVAVAIVLAAILGVDGEVGGGAEARAKVGVVVERMGPGEVAEQGKTFTETLVELEAERVVGRVHLTLDGVDVVVRRVGTGCC